MSTQFRRPSETIVQALERALGSYTVVAERRLRRFNDQSQLDHGLARQSTYASVHRIYLSGNEHGKRIALEQAIDISTGHAGIRWFVIVGDKEVPL